MKTKLLFACALGAILSSCQNEDSLEGLQSSNPEVQNIKFELVSDQIVTTPEDSAVTLRSALSGYETSIPIYRSYAHNSIHEKSDHYYGKEFLGSTFRLNGFSYNYEGQDFNMESKKSPYAVELYRHYSATLNDHQLSTRSSVPGYTQQGAIGYIYGSPQLGTVPLKEFYSSQYKEYFYVARNSDVDYLNKNSPTYKYQKTIGYVYAGERIDAHKTANTIRISKIQTIPCQISMKINARYGSQKRALTYQTYLPERTGTSSGGTGSITLDPTLSISSIDLTVTTFDPITNRSYTNTFHLTAANHVYEVQVRPGMTLKLTAYTILEGSETAYSMSYSL